MENTQDYQDYQDYRAEILGIVRSNASPGIMRNKLEDYHENDLADVFPDLSVAERRKLCRILNLDMLADIFEYIDEKQAAEYLDEMDVRKAASNSFPNGNRCGCRCTADDSKRKESSFARADG